MRRVSFRLGALILAGIALVLVSAVYLPGAWERNRAYANCGRATTSECLAALGFAEARRAWHLPKYMIEIDQLAQIGYIDAAFALERRLLQAAGLTPEAAKDAADRRVASQRITAAIRGGASVEAAFDGTPQADAGKLWISALDLLGRQPYGGGVAAEGEVDASTRAIVSDMAALMARLAQGEPPRPATSHLVYAAELQAMLEDRTAVLRALGQLPAGDRSDVFLDDVVLQLIGLDAALPLCVGSAACETGMRIRLAVATHDAARVRGDLERVFAAAESEAPWPDLKTMEKTVAFAARGGDPAEALALARRVADAADTKPSFAPVFPHISAARALLVAGASADEIRQRLDLAEAAFPGNPRTVIGIGFNAGPIKWGGFGLDAEARREIAGLRARLGDMDAAIALMKGIPQPDFAWSDMLRRDIPVEYLDRLLQVAKGAMSADDYAYVRACHAQDLVVEIDGSKPTLPQITWAAETAADILQAKPPTGRNSGLTYACLARVGRAAGDADLYRLAVERMAQSALASGNFTSLFRAAIAWHAYQAAAKG